MIYERIKWLNTYIENSIFTKANIAMHVGISPGSLRDLLLYGRKAVNREKFTEICKLLNINPDFFYDPKVTFPFLKGLYKIRIQELVTLIDIFRFGWILSGLALSLRDKVYYLLFKSSETIFIIAKKKLIGKKNTPFGQITQVFKHLTSLSNEISLKFISGVSIEPEDFVGHYNFIDDFFDKCNYEDCAKYFEKEILITLQPSELELLYFLRNKGIKTLNQTLSLLEKELDISKEWFKTRKGIIFSDYQKDLQNIRGKKVLSQSEIEFIINLIRLTWVKTNKDTPVNPSFVKNLIAVFEYIYKNCQIKNIENFGGAKYFESFISNPNIPTTVGNAEMYIARDLVWLFRDGEFEMTQKDCEIVSSLLLPWGYYVALSYLNKEREKISSAWFDNLEFLEMSGSDFVFESFDIPENLQKDNLGLYIIVSAYNLNKAKEGWQTAGGYSIDLKDKQTYIHMTLYDLVEFVLLIKHTPAVKDDTEHKVGGFVLTITPKEKFPYAFRKICQGFIVQILFTEEQFAELKEIVEHFEKYEKFMKYAYRCYVEKYGFV